MFSSVSLWQGAWQHEAWQNSKSFLAKWHYLKSNEESLVKPGGIVQFIKLQNSTP